MIMLIIIMSSPTQHPLFTFIIISHFLIDCMFHFYGFFSYACCRLSGGARSFLFHYWLCCTSTFILSFRIVKEKSPSCRSQFYINKAVSNQLYSHHGDYYVHDAPIFSCMLFVDERNRWLPGCMFVAVHHHHHLYCQDEYIDQGAILVDLV